MLPIEYRVNKYIIPPTRTILQFFYVYQISHVIDIGWTYTDDTLNGSN